MSVLVSPRLVCACGQDGSLSVRVSLESADGNTSYASTSFDDIGGEWRRHEATLTVSPEVRCISTERCSWLKHLDQRAA